MKKFFVVGNWKMNLNVGQASLLTRELHDGIKIYDSMQVILAPSHLDIVPVSQSLDRRKFGLCAQNAFSVDSGAFTGEVSFKMLTGLVEYCLVGHSERRGIFHESLPMIRDKVSAALKNDIVPILCVGETAQQRKTKKTDQVLKEQLSSALGSLSSADFSKILIAYEPVWAVGASEPANVGQIESAFRSIKKFIKSNEVKLLYGGDVTEQNADELLLAEDLSGFLVGHSSIDAAAFSEIVEKSNRFKRNNG